MQERTEDREESETKVQYVVENVTTHAIQLKGQRSDQLSSLLDVRQTSQAQVQTSPRVDSGVLDTGSAVQLLPGERAVIGRVQIGVVENGTDAIPQGNPALLIVDPNAWEFKNKIYLLRGTLQPDPTQPSMQIRSGQVGIAFHKTDAAVDADGNVSQPVAGIENTELEGDWHLVSATDKDGLAVDVRPANMTFSNDQYTLAYQGDQIDRRVEIYPDTKEIRYFKDESGFVQDHYLLEGDQLTIYDENRRNVYQRGHVALPKSISKATEEQTSLWRSAIVDIFREYNSAEDGTHQDPVGKGVVISPTGLVICQVPEEIQREKDSKSKFIVRFDDGGFAYTTIVEEADHGWFVLQPTQQGNHQFPIVTSAIKSGDQVHLWACDSSSPPQRVSVDLATVILLNRQTAKAEVPVCQLTRPTDFRAESCPVLSGDGELLGITLRDTGDLVLVVPGSQLKSMFPKTFAQ